MQTVILISQSSQMTWIECGKLFKLVGVINFIPTSSAFMGEDSAKVTFQNKSAFYLDVYKPFFGDNFGMITETTKMYSFIPV